MHGWQSQERGDEARRAVALLQRDIATLGRAIDGAEARQRGSTAAVIAAFAVTFVIGFACGLMAAASW